MSKVKKKKTAKQTYFNLLWLNEHEWLKQGDNRTLFGCKRCAKTDLKLGNMGLRAVVSHMKSRSHLKAEDVHKNVHKSVQNFFKKHKPSASPHSSSSQASEMSTLTSNSASASSSQVETTRSRYHQHLEDEKLKKEKDSQEIAKEILAMEIEQVEARISVLQRSTDEMNSKFEKMVMDSAKMENSDEVLIVINEATALKKKANEQTKDIKKLEGTVKEMVEKMKGM